ncbi:GroES-like protein [Hypoxylon sp. FL1150]|nr:GroES-like protein [Hypoxylon sp. FL1150]
MSKLPSTMRALVAPKYCEPKDYEVADVPVPTITGPKDVLIKMHAVGITTGDTQLTKGLGRFVLDEVSFPLKVGVEGAGVVAAVGSDVAQFRPGDEVYAFAFSRPMQVTKAGFCGEYAVAQERLTLHKPAGVPFEQASSMANLVTAYQAIEQGLALMRANGVADADGRGDGLEGKTVFVPGALSATGSVGVQLLKRVYGAGKVIASVSTAKVPLVEEYLPRLVDQVVDYTKVKRLTDAIPAGSVDLVYNTQWIVVDTFPLLKPRTGVCASIASVPAPEMIREVLPPMPFFVYWLAALAQVYYAFRLRGTGVKHTFISGMPEVREDLERCGEFLATGKVRQVIRVVALEDIERVREEAQKVATGKGGVGKLVVKIV